MKTLEEILAEPDPKLKPGACPDDWSRSLDYEVRDLNGGENLREWMHSAAGIDTNI